MKLLRLRPVINKRNGQVNLSLPRKQMPKKMLEMIKSNSMPILKLRMVDFK